MVIVLDDRERDGIEQELRRYDVEVSVAHLDFADCMFAGNGPEGREVMVGCERKRLSDLVNSMKDRRLSGLQLRGMAGAYDFSFLVVEAVWRPGAHGEIEELCGHKWLPFYRQGRPSERTAVAYRQLISYLTSLELCGNIIVRRTGNAHETAATYVALHSWFNDKEWHQHHSHDQIYTNEPMPTKAHGSQWGETHSHDTEYVSLGRGRAGVVLENPTTCWRMAAMLPGIDRKAEVVAAHFKTARAMVNAGEKEWMGIDFGRRRDGKRNPGIGKITAAAVVRAITEEGA